MIGSKIRETEQSLAGHVTAVSSRRRPPITQTTPEAPLLRSADNRPLAVPTPAAQAPTPDPRASYIRDGTGSSPDPDDIRAVVWDKMIRLIDAPVSTGSNAPNYSWDYIHCFFENVGNQVPPFRLARLEYETRLLSVCIAAMAKAYYDDGPPLPRFATSDDADVEFSMMCTLLQTDSPDINGFLVRHVEGLGFFDLNDLMASDTSLGTPVLVPWHS